MRADVRAPDGRAASWCGRQAPIGTRTSACAWGTLQRGGPPRASSRGPPGSTGAVLIPGRSSHAAPPSRRAPARHRTPRARAPPVDEGLRRRGEHGVGARAPCGGQRETLARVLVERGKHPDAPPIADPVPDEVVGPAAVRPPRPGAGARSVHRPVATFPSGRHHPTRLWLARRPTDPPTRRPATRVSAATYPSPRRPWRLAGSAMPVACARSPSSPRGVLLRVKRRRRGARRRAAAVLVGIAPSRGGPRAARRGRPSTRPSSFGRRAKSASDPPARAAGPKRAWSRPLPPRPRTASPTIRSPEPSPTIDVRPSRGRRAERGEAGRHGPVVMAPPTSRRCIAVPLARHPRAGTRGAS